MTQWLSGLISPEPLSNVHISHPKNFLKLICQYILYVHLFCTRRLAVPEDQQLQQVTGQNGIGQNGTDKMVATFIDSNSTELNFYSVTTRHK